MSLVAYDASSDEEDDSDVEDKDEYSSKVLSSKNKNEKNPTINQITAVYTNGHISDEEDECLNINNKYVHSDKEKVERKGLHLPSPKKSIVGNIKAEESTNLPFQLKLPAPKTSSETKNSFDIVEDDDEFLHKKEIEPPIEKPPPPKKQPVKITIPSLSQFMDFKVENKKEVTPSTSNKSASLLAMLPDPQNENVFNAKNTENSKRFTTTTSVTSLIPDHIKNKKLKTIKNSAISNKKQNQAKPSTSKSLLSDSEESDEEQNEDFFSLNTKSKLPEVSDSEIKALVDKKVAQMTKVSRKIDEMGKEDKNQVENDAEFKNENSTSSVDQLALEALVGASQAKRKKFVEDVKIVEISSEQVLPNRDEWMRASLTAETSYQPRGLLVDEEPAPGTRKKHQITYLAHQAKANEAELQAMWAANRQNRRAAASKYGF